MAKPKRLTDEQRAAIREEYARGVVTQSDLGRRYGVAQSAIHYAINPFSKRELDAQLLAACAERDTAIAVAVYALEEAKGVGFEDASRLVARAMRMWSGPAAANTRMVASVTVRHLAKGLADEGATR